MDCLGKKKEKVQLNSKNILNKINSKYILKTIFWNLSKKGSLNIIKYNKTFQKILEINEEDFKEYLEKFSPIEIEIIPALNEKGIFINIPNKKNKSHFHIFFNDSNDEIYNNCLEEDDKVFKIKIIIDHKVVSFNKLFENCKCIESINFKKFYRINIEDMRSMFWQCSSLKEVNMSKFITNNVINMSWMFYRCHSLKKIDMSNCNIDSLTKMVGIFWGCSSLEEVNLPRFKVDNEINMRCMFSECPNELR